MDFDVWMTVAVRLINAILWTVFAVQVFREDRPLIRLARQMVLPVILVGMWMLVVGSMATLGIITGNTARTCYTLFSAGAAVIAATLVFSKATEG